MDVKKYWWLGLLAAASTASLASCLVDDRALDQGETFVCKDNSDCFENSECVRKPKAELGRCVLRYNVHHCVDLDEDGFESVIDPSDNTQIAECGFDNTSNDRIMDCDDGNKDINPNAVEICDGIDNNCDGCIDGELQEGKCIPLTSPGLEEMGTLKSNEGVCQNVPTRTCVEGQWSSITQTDAYMLAKKFYSPQNEGINIEKAKRYHLCDGRDNDCDGVIDDPVCCEALPSEPILSDGVENQAFSCAIDKDGLIHVFTNAEKAKQFVQDQGFCKDGQDPAKCACLAVASNDTKATQVVACTSKTTDKDSENNRFFETCTFHGNVLKISDVVAENSPYWGKLSTDFNLCGRKATSEGHPTDPAPSKECRVLENWKCKITKESDKTVVKLTNEAISNDVCTGGYDSTNADQKCLCLGLAVEQCKLSDQADKTTIQCGNLKAEGGEEINAISTQVEIDLKFDVDVATDTTAQEALKNMTLQVDADYFQNLQEAKDNVKTCDALTHTTTAPIDKKYCQLTGTADAPVVTVVDADDDTAVQNLKACGETAENNTLEKCACIAQVVKTTDAIGQEIYKCEKTNSDKTYGMAEISSFGQDDQTVTYNSKYKEDIKDVANLTKCDTLQP